MYVVALCELGADLEQEAAPLAGLLGLTAFDVRTRAAGILPRVLFQSPSHDEANRALATVRTRGHGALLCDTREVIPGADMVQERGDAVAPPRA